MNQPVGKALEPDEVIDGQHTTRQDAVDEVMGQRIFFSVGEPSGDLHAANLIECMRRMDPTTRVRGFGGFLETMRLSWLARARAQAARAAQLLLMTLPIVSCERCF